MVDFNELAKAAIGPSLNDAACCGSNNRRACRCGNIDAVVRTHLAGHRIFATWVKVRGDAAFSRAAKEGDPAGQAFARWCEPACSCCRRFKIIGFLGQVFAFLLAEITNLNAGVEHIARCDDFTGLSDLRFHDHFIAGTGFDFLVHVNAFGQRAVEFLDHAI